LKTLSEMEAKPIPGTSQDVLDPFFSPDGRWIGFYVPSERRLKKIAITGGASVTIGDLLPPFGANWHSDDEIVVGQGPGGIVRVSSNGGKPETIITMKPGEEADGPQVLPGGNTVLFTVAAGTSNDRWDKAQIVAQSLKTGERKLLIDGGSGARYVQTGHIVYALGSTLLAVPFDVKKLQVAGGPVPVVQGTKRGINPGANAAAANFTISSNGSLAFISGSSQPFGETEVLAVVDRTGAKELLSLPAASYFQPRFSPDGKQVSVVRGEDTGLSVWIYDLLGSASPRRLTFGGNRGWAIWTRDGQHIVFRDEGEGNGIFWQRADGSGTA
jgi:serine/threonine-protein kinase